MYVPNFINYKIIMGVWLSGLALEKKNNSDYPICTLCSLRPLKMNIAGQKQRLQRNLNKPTRDGLHILLNRFSRVRR